MHLFLFIWPRVGFAVIDDEPESEGRCEPEAIEGIGLALWPPGAT